MLRWKLWKIRNSLPDDMKKVGFYLLFQLCSATDYYLLQQYTRKIGRTIVLQTNFNHAEESLLWLDKLTQTIRDLEYIDHDITFIFLNTNDKTLDAFLVNSRGGTVDIVEYSEAIADRLSLLHTTITTVKDPKYSAYYNSRLPRLLNPILTIQESLLEAAKQT